MPALNIDNTDINNKSKINTCKDRLSFFKQIADEKCRKVPNQSRFYRESQGFGVFLYSKDECQEASEKYINEITNCISLTNRKNG